DTGSSPAFELAAVTVRAETGVSRSPIVNTIGPADPLNGTVTSVTSVIVGGVFGGGGGTGMTSIPDCVPVIVELARSVVVIDWVPTVLSVAEKVCAPASPAWNG